jgi:hypothetical protein
MRALLGFVVAFGLAASPASAASTVSPVDAWHFEALSLDAKRALLRRLDPEMRSRFDVRVVDVESRTVIEELTLPELARVPASTIGGKPTEIAELEWMLASPAFGRDLVRGAAVAAAFPFGACGRLAASPSAISFDAGDWLYVADTDGRVRRRMFDEAAYDPRFSPDGKWLFFRRATGHDRVLARYEMFVSPSDLSAPPRPIAGTAGMHDRFVIHPDGKTAFALASQPGAEACFVSLGLKPPFATKKLACVDGAGERVVESAISPKGKWAALSTHRRSDGAWHLRVVSLATGKVARDEPSLPGLVLRAVSDSGLVVESGLLGARVLDAASTSVHALPPDDLGPRAFFKSDTELVYGTEGSVATLDVTKE